ncbi:MAG: hypothetical protein CMH63_01770 [Nanoarchaeota archaeon]|nr:hypothetical protein [Nanoarchaeota archaeon]|tara:strand:+ start:1830 stop:2297 length:468 start_codon:yes stop_codon:yes gene_type:complete
MKKRGILIILIALLLILSPLYFVFKTDRCDTAGCFETAADSCDKAKILVEESEGTTTSLYTIKGKDDDNCLLNVEVKKVSPTFSEFTKNSFEGKEMLCEIPLNEFSRMSLEEMGANLDYCHGPLKEAMYEAVVKKLYNLVVKDMATVLEEVERNL